jgi:hypothetical protein
MIDPKLTIAVLAIPGTGIGMTLFASSTSSFGREEMFLFGMIATLINIGIYYINPKLSSLIFIVPIAACAWQLFLILSWSRDLLAMISFGIFTITMMSFLIYQALF